RLWSAARRAPLTYYDMNLSAQVRHPPAMCAGTVYLVIKQSHYSISLINHPL
ncbi:jg24572, partial [Pararge aegeria aegeria]